MTRRDEHEQAKELAELWQRSFVPVEDEGAAQVRGKRMALAIGDAIVRERGRRRRSRFARAFGALALAAGVLGAVVGGRALLERPRQTGNQSSAMHVDPAIGGVQAAGIVTLRRGRAPSVIDASPVHAGDRITTAVNATAALKLGQTVEARVAEATEVSVEAPLDSTHHMKLAQGRIEATVDNRPSAHPKLVVDTPQVRVVVTGTVLQVEVLRREDLAAGTVTRVTVEEGHVDIQRDGQVVATVAAGGVWASAPDPAPAAESPQAAASPAQPASRRSAEPSTTRSAPGTLAVENALFEAAVSARKRGSHHVALAHLDDLLTRYPSSPLAEEARLERGRALEKLGRTDGKVPGLPTPPVGDQP